MAGLSKMEETLMDRGWLTQGKLEEEPKSAMPLTMRASLPRPESRK
jgi:hypothetical protein